MISRKCPRKTLLQHTVPLPLSSASPAMTWAAICQIRNPPSIGYEVVTIDAMNWYSLWKIELLQRGAYRDTQMQCTLGLWQRILEYHMVLFFIKDEPQHFLNLIGISICNVLDNLTDENGLLIPKFGNQIFIFSSH